MTRLQRLDSGVRLVTERVDGVRSCGVGLYLNVGSRFELPSEAGLSHFAEHMLFKGTPRYNALALNERLNELGGNFNAFTGQETICLHGRTVDHKAPASLDLLLEMLLESVFPEAEIQRERNVILEEYTFYEDTPDDLVVDLFFRNLWPAHRWANP
jgi:predicted Zn-dependent peptidase